MCKPDLTHESEHYYDVGGVPTINVIRAKLTREQYEGFLLGNVIKYSLRMNHKGNPVSDANKLAEYAMWLSEINERAGDDPAGADPSGN